MSRLASTLRAALVVLTLLTLCLTACNSLRTAGAGKTKEGRLLLVATPGIRNYLEYGGHGLLVFDIDNGHRFVKRIPLAGLNKEGKPSNVKGIAANAQTGRVYVSTLETVTCLDLETEKILWEKPYDGGCDRMSLSPDGKIMYLPTLEKDDWHVVDALTGNVITKISPKSGAHNTVYGPDGKFAYLAGLRSPLLTVADTATHTVAKTVGPFSAAIRPFTINGSQTLCFVNVNGLLGFEVGDLRTGKQLFKVEVEGFRQGPVKRHGCPSHGIALTNDEKEIWVADAFNQRVHVFDATPLGKNQPPKLMTSIPVRDQPGWITFSIDGSLAYPSTGEVVDAKTKKVIAALTDETGRAVGSEKLLEVDFSNNKPVRAGDQFGIGHITNTVARAAQ